MTRRTAIVHAGVEKTGSTAIQHWLAANRAALLGSGLLVPTRIGSPNHTRLVAACLDDGVVDNIKSHLMTREGLTEAGLRAQVEQGLAEDLATPGWDRVVITSELITSRLHAPSELSRLVALLRRHVDDIHFVVFLRRQDDLAVSRFSSALRAGHSGFDDVFADLSANSFRTAPPGRVTDDLREYFDYERILARFAAIPDARLTVLSHDPPGGSPGPIRSLCAVLGVDYRDDTPEPRLNAALSAEAQYVVSQLNRRHRVLLPSGARNEPYRAILRRVEQEVTGQRRTVPRAEAEAFLSRYEAGNARVAAEHFGGSGLFREGFEAYPETVDYGPMMARLQPVVERYEALVPRLPQQGKGLGARLHRVLGGLRSRGDGR